MANLLAYDADPSGFRDSSAAVEAAIADLTVTRGRLLIPAGTYKIIRPLAWANLRGVVIEGDGMHASTLVWAGDAGVDMLTLINADKVAMRDFWIKGNSSSRPRALVSILRDLDHPSAPAYGVSNNLFYSMRLGGDGANMMDYAVAIEGDDQNNDQHRFEQIQSDNARLTHIYTPNSQTKGLKFDGCVFSGGQSAVDGRLNLEWRGGYIVDMSVGAFRTNQVGDGLTVTGRAGFEGCKRLVDYYGGATSNCSPMTFEGIRFAHNNLHADGRIMNIRTSGPVVVRGCTFGEYGQSPGHIYVDGGGAKLSLSVVNNGFDGTGADAVDPVQINMGGAVDELGTVSMRCSDNVYRKADGVQIHRDGSRTITASTGTITALHNNWVVNVNYAGAVNISSASHIARGFEVLVCDTSGNASNNPITFTPYTNGTTSHTIDGANASKVIINTNFGRARLMFDGSMWHTG